MLNNVENTISCEPFLSVCVCDVEEPCECRLKPDPTGVRFNSYISIKTTKIHLDKATLAPEQELIVYFYSLSVQY